MYRHPICKFNLRVGITHRECGSMNRPHRRQVLDCGDGVCEVTALASAVRNTSAPPLTIIAPSKAATPLPLRRRTPKAHAPSASVLAFAREHREANDGCVVGRARGRRAPQFQMPAPIPSLLARQSLAN